MSKQKNIRLNPDVLLEKLPLEPETNALIVKLSDFDIPKKYQPLRTTMAFCTSALSILTRKSP